jgi:hypothetical protein
VTTTTKIDNEDQDAIVKNRPSLTEEQVAEMTQEAIDEYYKLDGRTCPTCLKEFKSYTGRRVHEGSAHWSPKESAKVQKKPTKKEPAAKNVSEAIDKISSNVNADLLRENEQLRKENLKLRELILKGRIATYARMISWVFENLGEDLSGRLDV